MEPSEWADNRIFAERSAEIADEQELVTSNEHPDIQKLFIDLENARTERIRRAKVTRKYRLQEIVRKYDAEAEIVKRQFLANKAMVREKLTAELTAQWFQIHREKRAMDMCVSGIPRQDRINVDFGWKLPERRSVQIKYRRAQNYEIMLLEETKKYFGMPAAPKISKISEEETNRDLALMRVLHLVAPFNNSNDRRNSTSV
jgi:Sds3-like